jgi:peptidoglycan/LPS O-acetylase OafA/YrhL
MFALAKLLLGVAAILTVDNLIHDWVPSRPAANLLAVVLGGALFVLTVKWTFPSKSKSKKSAKN